MRTTVLGRPGGHARNLAKKSSLAAAVWSLVWAVSATATYVIFFSAPSLLRTVALFAGAAGVLASTHRISQARTDYGRAMAGVRAEKTVAAALERVGVAAVVHGAVIAGGDADHVALGPVSVVVETKHGRGAVRMEGGKLSVGGRVMPRDPITQVQRQSHLVAKVIGRSVDPVVCISSMTGRPQQLRGVWVCAPQDLGAVLANLNSRVSVSEANELARRLDAKRDGSSPKTSAR